MNSEEEMLSRQIKGLKIFEEHPDKKSCVISCLAMRNDMTMQQIERACSMPESTASKILNSLLTLGFVTAYEVQKTRVGRPTKLFKLVDNWYEKINNQALNTVDDKLKKLRTINSLLSERKERD